MPGAVDQLVRARVSVPTIIDFQSAVGSPLVVDSSTGDLYVVTSGDTVTRVLGASLVGVFSSVVTPLVGTLVPATLSFQYNSALEWGLTNVGLFPFSDNTRLIGSSTNRVAQIFTPIIDSGTTGSLSLRTNSGQTQVSVRDLAGTAANQIVLAGGISTLTVLVGADGTDSNIGMRVATKGTGGIEFFTNSTITNGALAAGVRQAEILHTANAVRNLTFTGAVAGGNPTISTTAGSLAITPAIGSLGGITANGATGVPVVVATGRATAQTGAKASVSTFTVGASDGSFEISANVNVTTSTAHNFTVTCAYTDEGNTARTLTFGFTQLSGATFITAITNVTGAGPYESPVYHIRCKSGTAITVATTGTFTTVTYNVEGIIKQTA